MSRSPSSPLRCLTGLRLLVPRSFTLWLRDSDELAFKLGLKLVLLLTSKLRSGMERCSERSRLWTALWNKGLPAMLPEEGEKGEPEAVRRYVDMDVLGEGLKLRVWREVDSGEVE